MKKAVLFFIIGLALIFAAPAARAQENLGSLTNPSTDVRVTLAQTVAELNDLKSQIEALKASIESNSHLIRSQTDSTSLKLSDMDARIGSLEDRLTIQSRQVTSAVSTVAPEAAAEAEMYQAGLNQINSSEFLKSIATFQKFMEKYPKSPYVSNAQYWIAECYFAMRDYELAIKQFQVLIDTYPKSEKVPAALLKQGYSFIELEMESDAKLFLDKLIKKYPHTKEAKEAKERLERAEKMKEEAKAKPVNTTGGIPLAPGVQVPEDNKAKKTNPTGKYQ